MNRRDLLTAFAALSGARAIDKAAAWAFPELDEHERWVVWVATGQYDGEPIDDESCARIPGLLERGYLERIEVPEGHSLRAQGITSLSMATRKGKRALERMGFSSDKDAA